MSYYYLHINGDLIHKVYEPVNSDFVKHIWYVDPTNRACAWKICLEALALNARLGRVKQLAEQWGLDIKDLLEYMRRNIIPSSLEKEGIIIFLEKIVGIDSNGFFDWLEIQEGEPDWSTLENYTGDLRHG